MKKYLSLLIFMVAATAVSQAQPKAKYEQEAINMGVLSWKDPALATFKITNVSQELLHIKSVEPGCDCTVVTWTKDPIRPGKSGIINVTYNARQLGHFEKDIIVRTDATDKPVYLSINGEVVQKKLEYTGEYPYHVGDIYLSSNNIEFDDVYKGDRRQAVLNVLNTGEKPYAMELMHLPKYITVDAQPKTLRSGRTGKFILTLDSRYQVNIGLNQSNIYLSRYQGDKVSDENEIGIQVIVLPESGKSDLNSPHLETNSNVLDFGTIAAGSYKKMKGVITLRNTGKTDLQIKSIQVTSPAIGIDVKRKIEPGKQCDLKVTLSPRFLKSQKRPASILMITNDPDRPKVTITINYKL